MKNIFLTSLIFIGSQSFAKSLVCTISLNTLQVYSGKVQTVENQKVNIGRSHGITAYVTEKEKSIFLVEAFLEVEDVRIYAQGALKNSGENVAASLWSRDSLVDIACQNP